MIRFSNFQESERRKREEHLRFFFFSLYFCFFEINWTLIAHLLNVLIANYNQWIFKIDIISIELKEQQNGTKNNSDIVLQLRKYLRRLKRTSCRFFVSLLQFYPIVSYLAPYFSSIQFFISNVQFSTFSNCFLGFRTSNPYSNQHRFNIWTFIIIVSPFVFYSIVFY